MIADPDLYLIRLQLWLQQNNCNLNNNSISISVVRGFNLTVAVCEKRKKNSGGMNKHWNEKVGKE